MATATEEAPRLDTGEDELQPSRITTWQRFKRNQLAVLGLGIVLAIVAVALAAPILPLADPNATAPAQRLIPPFSEGYVLGTDQLGRDILSRLIWGTRVSLAVGIAAALVATLIGSLIGILAAYFGRATDQVLMRGIDMLMAFPYLLLALAIVAALGPGLMNALLAIAVVNIPFFARAVRGATLSLVQRELSAVVPLFDIQCSLVVLAFGALLGGDRLGDRLAQMHQIVLHSHHRLVEHGLGIFGPLHPLTDLSTHDSRQSLKHAHRLITILIL